MAKGVGALCTLAIFLSCVASLAPPVQAALPTVIGTFAEGLTGDTRDFDSQGDLLGCLVTKRGRGPELFLLGLQDPVNPTVLGTLDVPEHLNRVVLRNNLAYVATSLNDQELLIVDVSDPASPQVVGGYDTPSGRDAISLAVAGSILFLGTERTVSPDLQELHIIDVSNPAAPVLLDSVHLGSDVNDLALEGDLLYAATSDNDRELVVFDVSVPTAVSELGGVDLPGSANAKASTFIAV
jgi:uncharacterized secreted protein with C-terminal beta-propeller domain